MRLKCLPNRRTGLGTRSRSLYAHVERLEGRAVPSGYTAASVTELVAAIDAANLTAEADTITLAAGKTFTLTSEYISPDGNEGGNGLPAIRAGEDLNIVGNGAVIGRSTNNFGFRFFEISAGASLTLQGLTLQGGFTPSGAGGPCSIEAR